MSYKEWSLAAKSKVDLIHFCWGGIVLFFGFCFVFLTTNKNQDFKHHFPLNLKKHLFLNMYFKVNYYTDKEQYSKLSKNLTSPQVSPIQPLIFILIFSIDADMLASKKRSCYIFLKRQTRQKPHSIIQNSIQLGWHCFLPLRLRNRSFSLIKATAWFKF